MSWRPKEGWKNPYKRGRYIAVQHSDKHIGETFENEEKEFQIYEASADAMVQGFIKFLQDEYLHHEGSYYGDACLMVVKKLKEG